MMSTFFALGGAQDVGGDRCSLDDWRADFGLTFAGDQQDAVEGDGLFVGGAFAVDQDGVAAGDLKLLAGFIDYRVHGCLS